MWEGALPFPIRSKVCGLERAYAVPSCGEEYVGSLWEGKRCCPLRWEACGLWGDHTVPSRGLQRAHDEAGAV